MHPDTYLTPKEFLNGTANSPTERRRIRSPHTIGRVSPHIVQDRRRQDRRALYQMWTVAPLHPYRHLSYRMFALCVSDLPPRIGELRVEIFADREKLARVTPGRYHILYHVCTV